MKLNFKRVVQTIGFVCLFIIQQIFGTVIQNYFEYKYSNQKTNKLIEFMISNLTVITSILILIVFIGLLMVWFYKDVIVPRFDNRVLFKDMEPVITDLELLTRYLAVTAGTYNQYPFEESLKLNFTEDEFLKVSKMIDSIKKPNGFFDFK